MGPRMSNSMSLNGSGLCRAPRMRRPSVARVAKRLGLLGSTALAGLFVAAMPVSAQQWTGQASSDFMNGANWLGGGVPNSSSAPVVFGAGAGTTVDLDTPNPGGYITVGTVTFNDPASAYTINVSNGAYFNIDGDVTNTSGVTQNFTVAGSWTGGSFINIRNANAGSDVVYTANAYGGVVFYSSDASPASGANAKFVLNGGSISLSGSGTLELGSVEGAGVLSYYGSSPTSRGTFQIGGLDTSTTLDGQIYEAGDGKLSITKVGTGTLTLTGASSYKGGTNLYGGTLSLGNDSALGTGTLSAFVGTTIDIQDGVSIDNELHVDASPTIHVGSGTATYTGKILNYDEPSAIFKKGAGTLILTSNDNNFSGTQISEGTIQVTANHALGTGAITLDGGTLQAGADGLVLPNTMLQFTSAGGTIDTQGYGLSIGATMADIDTPTGTFTKKGTGTLTITGAADSNFYKTATDVAEGTLKAGSANIFSKESAYTIETGAKLSLNDFDQSVGSLAGAGAVDIGSATLTTGNDNSSTVFSGALSGTGELIKAGTGTFELSGISTFSGPTEVKAGTMMITGDLSGSDVTVDSGAVLGGDGTVGGLEASGTVEPGKNAIGTLTVAGNASFADGSTYAVELGSGTSSDLIDVSGAVTITGGAALAVTRLGTSAYVPGAHYVVLTAVGDIDGEFTLDSDPQVSTFLALTLGQSQHDVYIDVTKTRSFGSVGLTPNQIATGAGLDTAAASALVDAVLSLSSDAAAQAAFDQLSGEIHASAKGTLLQDSHFLQDAMTARLRGAFGGGAAALPIMAYGEGGPELVPANSDRFAFWSQGFGAWGRTGSDNNAASFERSTGGLLVGADGAAGDWRLGLVGGYSRTSFDAAGRHSSGASDNYQLGLYGGTELGAVAFRSGVAYTWHRISTSRSVDFQGFADHLAADYDAATGQAFGELAYKTETGPFAFEPFANLAYVSLHTDGFAETGGAASLASSASNTDATFTTLGVRASTDVAIGGVTATARGLFGLRHAFGDVTPLSSFAFAGGDNFTIAGTPIARDAVLVEAGLDMQLAANATLGLSYAGQFGADTADNGFKANIGVKF